MHEQNSHPRARQPSFPETTCSLSLFTFHAVKNRSTSSAVPRVTVPASGTIRLSSPASTLPGRLDKRRAGRECRAARMHSTQRTGAVSCSNQEPHRLRRFPDRLGRCVATPGNADRENAAPASAFPQPVDRRLHQRRMKCPAHLERHYPFGAARFAAFAARATASGSPRSRSAPER